MRARSALSVASLILLAACGGGKPSNAVDTAHEANDQMAVSASMGVAAPNSDTPTPVSATTPSPTPTAQTAAERVAMWDWSAGGAVNCYDRGRVTQQQAEVAERSGAAPCDADAKPAAKTDKDTADGWAGQYEGPFDGGPGEVTIEGAGGGAYRISASVTGEGGCSGEAEGTSTPRGNRLVLRSRSSLGGMCAITLDRSGQSLSVSEADCTDLHGMSCAFSGTARRKR